MLLKTKQNEINLNAGVKNILNCNYVDHLSNLKYLNIAGPGINYYIGIKFNIINKQQKHEKSNFRNLSN